MCKGKFKRGLVSVVALGMSVVMFSGCELKRKGEDKAEPVFRPDPNAVEEPAAEETTLSASQRRLEKAKDINNRLEKELNKNGYSTDPNKRLGKDSNGNYVEKKCVNPYCGCVDCKCKPCECDDR